MIPYGISDFRRIRNEGLYYVDKTDMLWRLASRDRDAIYFISRPTLMREKGYANSYKADKRPVSLVGINFSAKKRNIDEPLIVAM